MGTFSQEEWSKDFSGPINMKNLFTIWLAPLLISVGLFFIARPTLAQLIPEQQQTLADYLKTNDLEVGYENKDGHTQVYHVYNNQKFFISNEGLNSYMPSSKGEYVVYVSDIEGAGQIFLNNIVAGTNIQLTYSGTNLDPKVSKNGWVVWEGWVSEKERWQVFLFDGKSVSQLTAGDLSMNPDIEGDFVVYGRRDISGGWRAVVYSKRQDKRIDVVTGEDAREPKLKNGKIILTRGDKFQLTVEDLFTLNLAPLVIEQPQTVSEQDILNELEAMPVATESGTLDALLTPTQEVSASPTPSPSLELTPTSSVTPEASITPTITQ